MTLPDAESETQNYVRETRFHNNYNDFRTFPEKRSRVSVSKHVTSVAKNVTSVTKAKYACTDNGRVVTTTDSTDYSVEGLQATDTRCLSPLAEDTDVNTLCEQMGSVDTSDSIETSTDTSSSSSNEFQADEHESLESNLMHVHALDSASVYTQDNDGDTYLHIAIILKMPAFTMICISKAATHRWLSFTNKLYQTPLHLAVLTRQFDVARKLVTSGADMLSRDKDGNTALHIACRDGLVDAVSKLLQPVRYPEVEHNKFDIPFQKIPQDFGVVNFEGYTCLHLAANNGHIEIVQMLIDSDVDVNMREGKTGRTVLHNACISGDLSLVKLLVNRRSCNINARSYDGLTPFDLARYWSNDQICMSLAGAGARYGDDETIDIDSD